MANQKRKISISAIVVLAVMGIASVAWVVYLEPYAAPPLPQQSMSVVFNTSYDGSVWQIRIGSRSTFSTIQRCRYCTGAR